MNSTRFIPVFIAGAGVALLQFPLPSHAALFTLTSPLSDNDDVKSFIDSGMALTMGDSNSTGLNPNTLNTNPIGLCAWTLVNSAAGRCGYGTTTGSGISAFTMSFDKPVSFNSFDVSQFETASISQGTIGFSLDNVTFTNFNFSNTGSVPVAFQALTPGQPIYVQTSATLIPNTGETGIFRLGSINVTEVPGPLPLLGVGAAFRMTRKFRKLSAKN
ncbi:MAG: hypothetical protein VKP70_04380 [Cyanobacteriota bacterium]|nr:hypothetical protein [Cyanobacteriota bacterium]